MRQWKTILHHGKTCISIKVINLHISFSDTWQLLRTHMLIVFGPKFRGPRPQCRQARPTYLTLMSSGKHFQIICNLQALWVQLNSSAKWWSTLALAHRIHHQSAAPSPRYTLGGQKSHDSFVAPCRHFCGIVNSCAAWRDNDRVQASMRRYDNMQAKNANCEHMESPERQTREIHKHFGQNSHFFNCRRSHRLWGDHHHCHQQHVSARQYGSSSGLCVLIIDILHLSRNQVERTTNLMSAHKHQIELADNMWSLPDLWALLTPQAISDVGSNWKLFHLVSNCDSCRLAF